MNDIIVPEEILNFIKAMASESRVKILLLFMDGQERTVNQITEAVGLGQSTTSEHLAIMKRSGLLVSKRQGKEVYYQPDRSQILHCLEKLSDFLKNCCG
jgi:DNA-binding transcriptional ArsR family regulator